MHDCLLLYTQNDESRVILHFHYTRWPDFGVPKTPDVFLDFLYAVRNSGVLNEDVGPCVVHCRLVAEFTLLPVYSSH